MPSNAVHHLKPKTTPGATVTDVGPDAWTLEMPPGTKGNYRLAQLDDYATFPRKAFPWQPPLTLNVRACVSHPEHPGTWGFGFWNDPFSLSLGFGGGTRRFLALPNAAWFFYASSQNYLSFRDDLPANGFLAGTFRSPVWPAPILALGVPALPLLIWRVTAQPLRRLASRVILQDAAQLDIDATQWHLYRLSWQLDEVSFSVDGETVLETPISPQSPLGFVLWIDNQYAALPPGGGLAFGSLPSDSVSRLDVEDLQIVSP